jgi:hypothetical protein
MKIIITPPTAAIGKLLKIVGVLLSVQPNDERIENNSRPETFLLSPQFKARRHLNF